MGVLNNYKVCFLGRTGNGKSTLINALYGTSFSTAPILSCTKELYAVTLMGNCPEGYDSITIYDTPGIGEFSSNDKYQRFYEEAVCDCDCIVLVLTLDRTDAPPQRLLLSLKQFIKKVGVRFVIAINHIDHKGINQEQSYVSWNTETNSPSDACQLLIQERTSIIRERYKDILNITKIVPVCGTLGYGMEELKNTIITK